MRWEWFIVVLVVFFFLILFVSPLGNNNNNITCNNNHNFLERAASWIHFIWRKEREAWKIWQILLLFCYLFSLSCYLGGFYRVEGGIGLFDLATRKATMMVVSSTTFIETQTQTKKRWIKNRWRIFEKPCSSLIHLSYDSFINRFTPLEGSVTSNMEKREKEIYIEVW